MTAGAIYTSHKNVTAILKTAFYSVAHVAMLASLSLTILVSTTEAFKAPDTPSRRSAIGPCQAVGDHLQLICRLSMLNWRWSPSVREITLIGGSVKPRESVCVCAVQSLTYSTTAKPGILQDVCVCACVSGGQGVSDDRA